MYGVNTSTSIRTRIHYWSIATITIVQITNTTNTLANAPGRLGTKGCD